MKEAVEELVHAPYLWMWLKQYHSGEQIDFDEITSMAVDRIRLRAAFEEKGKQNRGLHVHMIIEIAHSTMVQINKQGMVQAMRQLVGWEPNVHCRFVKGQGEDKNYLLHYITKEVPRTKPSGWQNAQLHHALVHGEEVEAQNLHP